MILPLLMSAALWLPLSGVYTYLVEQVIVFNKPRTIRPSELQALNIRFDYVNSPEP